MFKYVIMLLIKLVDEENFKKLWTTIERQDLMEKAYPNIVKKYLDSTKKTSKCKAKKNEQENKITAYIKLDKEIETLNKSLQKMNVDNVKPKRKRKNLEASFNTSIKNKKLRKRLNKNGLVQKNLDSFMKVKKNVNLMETNDKILNNSIAGKNYLNSSLNNSSIIFPDNLTFNSDYSEAELSNIVQNIIFDKSLHKKANEYYNSTPIKVYSPSNVLLKSSFSVAGISQKKCKKRISHFFDHLSNDVDEFERSLDLKRNSLENCVNDISSDSSENLKENLFEDFNCLNTSKNIQTPVSSKTGSPVYTPLCERIKKYNLLKQ